MWFQQRDGLKKEDLDLLDDMFTGDTVVSLKAELEGVRAEIAQKTTTNERINLDLEMALARVADLEGQLASMVCQC